MSQPVAGFVFEAVIAVGVTADGRHQNQRKMIADQEGESPEVAD
jgi:hypothetical protein